MAIMKFSHEDGQPVPISRPAFFGEDIAVAPLDTVREDGRVCPDAAAEKTSLGAGVLQRPRSFLKKHENVFWWLHSVYALLFGMAAMWIGNKNFSYLRLIILQLGFIWITSLCLPALAASPRISPAWRSRICLIINYCNKNFYQQLLFFIIPIYYSSATLGSHNLLFMLLLVLTALLSTLDVVYDRYLSRKWPLMAFFFAFSLFAGINASLPILWCISSDWAVVTSAMLAMVSFVVMLYRFSRFSGRKALLLIALVGVLSFLTIGFGRSFIPPIPLSLYKTEFGEDLDQETRTMIAPLTGLAPTTGGKVYALSAIKAPLGLKEKVGYKWYLDERLVKASRFYEIAGGRENGYRIWSYITLTDDMQGKKTLRLDIETEAGQLIGRATLPFLGRGE